MRSGGGGGGGLMGSHFRVWIEKNVPVFSIELTRMGSFIFRILGVYPGN